MVEKIDEKDAVRSVHKACETNNVALLVQMLPETYGHFNAASALVATKLDNFEAFKVIGKYLKADQWTQYEKMKESISEQLSPENKCVVWAKEESKVRNADMESYSKKSFIAKTIEFLKEDRDKALYEHPQYEKGEHSEILSFTHLTILNKKLKVSNACINKIPHEDGFKYYTVTMEKKLPESSSNLVKTMSFLNEYEIFSSSSINETMDFLNKNYSKELYPKLEVQIDKENSKSQIESMREQFVNKPKTTTDLRS